MRAVDASMPEEGQGKEPFGTLPPDGITPIGSYKVPPEIQGLRQTKALLPGHDRHIPGHRHGRVGSSTTPSTGAGSRSSARLAWQDYLGVDYYWPVTRPNLARTRTAQGGNQNVRAVSGPVRGPGQPGAATPRREAAPPPAVTTQQPVTGGAAFPQWGF